MSAKKLDDLLPPNLVQDVIDIGTGTKDIHDVLANIENHINNNPGIDKEIWELVGGSISGTVAGALIAMALGGAAITSAEVLAVSVGGFKK